MALIDNWKDAPKMYVVQTLAIIATVQAVWTQLPPDVVAKLPAYFSQYVTLFFTVFGVIVRVLKQDSVTPGDFK